MNDKQELQKKVMVNYLNWLNKKAHSPHVLKGGTALMLGYHLDRFSEDIDLDCSHQGEFIEITKAFADKEGYGLRIAKDTSTTQRCFLHFDDSLYIPNVNEPKPLKIEVSYRNKVIRDGSYSKINDINIYTIDMLFSMKGHAYSNRDRIRDLYDLCFIVEHYYHCLNEETIDVVARMIAYHGLDKCEYIISTQSDTLLNTFSKEELYDKCLRMFDTLQILDDQNESPPHFRSQTKTDYNVEK